jgi:hypothetical protein
LYNQRETGDYNIPSFHYQFKLNNMSCCGNKRKAWARTDSLPSQRLDTPYEYKKIPEDVYFEYIGATALAVTGSVSGKKYRFLFSGDRQLIDYRDASGMMGVPVLKDISKEIK